MKRSQIQDLDWDAIWARYHAGESSTPIAKDYNVTGPAICYGLKCRGHKLRTQRETILQGRQPVSKKESDLRYYKKNASRIKLRMKDNYLKDPDSYRQKSKRAIGSLPPPGTISKVCRGCRIEKDLTEYGVRISGKYQRRPKCKQCECGDALTWRKQNPEKRKAVEKRYRESTPVEKRRSIRNKAQRKAMLNPINKLASTLRKQLLEVLNHRGIRRQESALKLVGCSVHEFKAHLKLQFLEGMSWDNHGVQKVNGPRKWHIDHIMPVDSFDLFDLEQRRQCFHFSNLQPLWAIENIQKSKKILGVGLQRDFAVISPSHL